MQKNLVNTVMLYVWVSAFSSDFKDPHLNKEDVIPLPPLNIVENSLKQLEAWLLNGLCYSS